LSFYLRAERHVCQSQLHGLTCLDFMGQQPCAGCWPGNGRAWREPKRNNAELQSRPDYDDFVELDTLLKRGREQQDHFTWESTRGLSAFDADSLKKFIIDTQGSVKKAA